MRLQRQRGVAVITALLLTTLAITIVASLFWQQQVQVRSIENQRQQLQKKWVLRAGVDWARLILREHKNPVDHLGEPWAAKLEETRLDQYVENGREELDESDASLSGQIVDAQSRFNLNNLADGGKVNPAETLVFARLLANLKLEPALAQRVAQTVAATQKKSDEDNPPNQAAPEVQFLRFSQIEDLLAVAGVTPDMLLRLKDYVVVLPDPTPVNINTTSAEVLAARLPEASLSDAAMVIASRDSAYFKNYGDIEHRFKTLINGLGEKNLSTKTSYFIVNGKVKMNRSTLDFSALVKRDTGTSGNTTSVLWTREN